MTRIGDLSSRDMKKIPPLALIELTALYDVLGLDLKRSRAGKWKGPGQKGPCVICVPLNVETRS